MSCKAAGDYRISSLVLRHIAIGLSRKRRNDNKEAEMRKRMDGGNNPQVESATLFINGQAPTLSVNGMSPYYTDRNRLITILDFRKRPAELSGVELSWLVGCRLFT